MERIYKKSLDNITNPIYYISSNLFKDKIYLLILKIYIAITKSST